MGKSIEVPFLTHIVYLGSPVVCPEQRGPQRSLAWAPRELNPALVKIKIFIKMFGIAWKCRTGNQAVFNGRKHY
jgi:hypothetical protein